MGMLGDFTVCDTATLNRFFRRYCTTHDVPKSQGGKGGYTGGTNTIQRNLRALFSYPADEHEHTDPYTDPKFQRYAAPTLGKPKTLSSSFVEDCLKVTGGGSPKVRDFHTTRDHAILRVLTEGLRSDELLNLRFQDLDLIHRTLLVIPLKADRDSIDPRVISLQPKTVKALRRYLRARAEHKRAKTDAWLWLGTRNRSRLLYAGLHGMVKRRAEEAGYDPHLVFPHSYDLTELAEAGLGTTDPVRRAVKLMSDGFRAAWDYGDVEDVTRPAFWACTTGRGTVRRSLPLICATRHTGHQTCHTRWSTTYPSLLKDKPDDEEDPRYDAGTHLSHIYDQARHTTEVLSDITRALSDTSNDQASDAASKENT